MLTRSQSRGKQQEATEAWEILEASTILMSMASSVIDEGHQPVDKLPSPNIAVFAPAQGQAGRSPLIKRRRDHLRVKLAASLSADQLVFIREVATDLIRESRNASDLLELKREAITHGSALDMCCPKIFEDEFTVKKMILSFEVVDLVDEELRALGLSRFCGYLWIFT